MDPTPQPTPASAAPPAIGAGAVELIRTSRQQVAYLLLGLGVVLLALAVWLGMRALKSGPPPADAPAAELNPLDPTAPPKPPEVADPKRNDYLVGAVATLSGFLVFASAGSILLVAIPKPGVEQQRADARLLLLTVGGAVGLVLILAGVAFFYRWSDSLMALLDKERTEVKQLWKVLVPLMMIALGAAVTFFSILPARADERNSTLIRRTVYGANLGLTVLLLVIALVIGNVIVAMRVPNKLDVTEQAITSISDNTARVIERMAEPVTVYHLGEGDRLANDTRALLDRMQEKNPSKLKIVAVSPTTDKLKYRELVAKYPALLQAIQQQQGGGGVLLTTGPDEKRHAFIKEDDLATEEPIEGGARGARRVIFLGEGKIAREIAFLAEGGEKAVVYVTQGGGELSLGGGGEPAPPDRSLSNLRAYLEKSNLDVKPLVFDPANPAVPADAEIVVVADPKSSFPPNVAAALDKYMTEPRGKQRGRMIVLGGAHLDFEKKIAKTGLEPLLAKFGVTVQDRLLMSEGTEQFDPFETVAVPTNVRNPIADVFQSPIGPWKNCRPLLAAQQQPGGPFQASPLFVSQPRRPSWLEDTIPADINRVMTELNNSPEVQRRKGISLSPRILCLAVTERVPADGPPGTPPPPPAPRLVVFGAGEFVSDAQTRTRGAAETATGVVAVAASADWLRERATIAAGEGTKTYATYKLSATADDTRLVLLPLGLALLIVIGLGAGVWVIRRS